MEKITRLAPNAELAESIRELSSRQVIGFYERRRIFNVKNSQRDQDYLRLKRLEMIFESLLGEEIHNAGGCLAIKFSSPEQAQEANALLRLQWPSKVTGNFIIFGG